MSIDFKRQSFAAGWLITNEKGLTRRVQSHRSGRGHGESPGDLCGHVLKYIGEALEAECVGRCRAFFFLSRCGAENLT